GEVMTRVDINPLNDRHLTCADDSVDDRDLHREPEARRHLAQFVGAHLVRRRLARPRTLLLFLDAEIVPLGRQPEVLESRWVLGVVPAAHPDLQAAEAIDLFLALDTGLNPGELED